MLFALALVPVIALLVFIYVKDKNEKEPFGLLTALFFAGMGTILPAALAENILHAILDYVIPYDSMFKAYFFAIMIVAPAEELGKYLVLRLITWKNKHFNYSYDAIVYSVFVSLGFACLENIGYVFSNGVGAAILRMFTAVPGHACFAVFMGFFYSKAKYASIKKNKKDYNKYIALTMIAPILIHGLYDGIIMSSDATSEVILSGLSLLVWIAFVIAMFVVSVVIIVNSSRNDFCIVTLPKVGQTVYRPSVAGTWTCTCGTVNNFNFCAECGAQRPSGSLWNCPKCGTVSIYNFCGDCGCPRPMPQAQHPVC